MSSIATEVQSTKSQISALQADILELQKKCTHSFKLVAQKHTGWEISHMHAQLECETCELVTVKEAEHPLCPIHLVEMESARDEKSKELAKARQEVLNGQEGYYGAFAYKCPCPGCEERVVLDQWDQ